MAIDAFDPRCQRLGVGEAVAACQFSGRQRRVKFSQRQGISAGLAENETPDALIETSGKHRLEQGAGVVIVQAPLNSSSG
jgi:hypothetical protein